MKRYPSLSPVIRFLSTGGIYRELGFEEGSRLAYFGLQNISGLNLRIYQDNPSLGIGGYPNGSVPGVRLGRLRHNPEQVRRPSVGVR